MPTTGKMQLLNNKSAYSILPINEQDDQQNQRQAYHPFLASYYLLQNRIRLSLAFTKSQGRKVNIWFLLLAVAVGFAIFFIKVYGVTYGDPDKEIFIATHPLENILKSSPPMQASHRRINLIGVWNGNDTPTYLRHFFHSIQLNAEHVDLLFVNRKIDRLHPRCIDFHQAQINIIWGGNVKVVCMEHQEWLQRHVNFLCSDNIGWNCTDQERFEVRSEFSNRLDLHNYYWRTIQGHVYRDLFINATLPFWGWIDQDTHLGRMSNFPFQLLSNFSLVTFQRQSPKSIFLAGQLTAFNFNDINLTTAWKKIPTLSSAKAFSRHTFGNHPEVAEEQLWSYWYLGVKESMAGLDLDYAILPDLLGDDPNMGPGSSHSFAISGKDVILIDSSETRLSIERMIAKERSTLAHFNTESTQADLPSQDPKKQQDRKIEESTCANEEDDSCKELSILYENVKMQSHNDCKHSNWIRGKWRICVPDFTLAFGGLQKYDATLIHTKGMKPGHLLRRLGKKRSEKTYMVKLLKHHHFIKHYNWLEFPDFDISEDVCLVISNRQAYVFKFGEHRERNLFLRSAF